MKYFSMFSGIGGFEHGIEQAYSRLARKRECDSSSSRGRKEVNGERTSVPQTIGNMHNPVCGKTSKNNPTCVGYSEINKYAKAIYNYHYPGHKNYGNAKDIVPEEIKDFDLLVGGFPCQAFSIAGKRGGFDDTRGTLFFDVARVLKAKQPDWFLLENVKGLCSHDSGKTLGTIYKVLTDLDYTVGWEVVNSCQFGVPQNRERIFLVGHLTEAGGRIGEILPIRKDEERNYASNEEGSQTNTIAPTIDTRVGAQTHRSPYIVRAVLTPDRLEKRQNGRRIKDHEEPSFTLTSQDKHGVQIGTKIRRLTPVECERLQGFPDGWTEYGLKEEWKSASGEFDESEIIEISDTQRYKALGNAVTVNVIEAITKKIFKANV